MIKKISMMILAVFAVSAFALPAGGALAVSNTPNIGGSLCETSGTLQIGGSTAGCDANANDTKVNKLIGKIINYVSIIVTLVAVIMIIVGGFKYIASGGDSGKVTGAKNTILYAIIGLIIVALAQFIVKFVLNTSNDVQV